MRYPGLILLAAGGSKRMGSPKQLLPWRGRTLLRQACETALGTSCKPVIAVLGCEADTCLNELKDLNVVSVANPNWEKGMGSSLVIGLSHLKVLDPTSPGALIMLVDQPAVTTNFLRQLCATWTEADQTIVATKYPHGGGVPAIIPRSYFNDLEGLDADQGARALIQREKANTRLVDFVDQLIDIDDRATYLRCTEALS